MREIKLSTLKFWKKPSRLRVGFLATNDCAPLVVAQELGLFEKYDLDVELRREINWSHLRDNVVDGELDAAHAPGTLPFLANMGVNSRVCRCVSAMVLSLQGNAVVLSRRLWNQGIRDATTLKQRIIRDWGKRTYTFGVMFPYSAQYFLLRRWLRSTGALCDVQVRIIAVPPTQMYPLLKLGYLDGYCAGEPWTTMAVQADVGAYVATSAQLAPMHPEKVLMVREDFAEKRAEEHERLIAALLEACALCDKPEFRRQLGGLLAQPHYVNAPLEVCDAALAGAAKPLRRSAPARMGSTIFFRCGATDPTREKAMWLESHLNEFLNWNDLRTVLDRRSDVTDGILRPDIYRRGYRLAMDALRQIAHGETPLTTTPLPSLLRQWRRKKTLSTRRRLTVQAESQRVAS